MVVLTRVKIIDRPGTAFEESLKALKETVYAAMQQQKGFKNLYFLGDTHL